MKILLKKTKIPNSKFHIQKHSLPRMTEERQNDVCVLKYDLLRKKLAHNCEFFVCVYKKKGKKTRTRSRPAVTPTNLVEQRKIASWLHFVGFDGALLT